jgi:inhibitor of the pro-sigma K processing machinery
MGIGVNLVVDLIAMSIPVVTGIILILLAIFLLGFLKRILENAVLGVLMLFVFNFIGGNFGLSLPITFTTVLVSAIGGLAGVGFLILAQLAGYSIK